jgi:hypothetical protein
MKIEISVEFLAEVLGTSAGSLKETLEKEGAKQEEIIKESVAKKLAQAKDEGERSGKKEGYGRGEREVSERYEAKLAEKLGTKVGRLDDIIAEYQQIVKSSIDKDDDPVKIRNSKVYLEDMKAEKLKVQEVETEYKTKLSTLERKEVESIVREKAIEIIGKKNYVLPQSEVARNNQINTLVKEIMNDNQFKVLDGKKVQILDKEGNAVRDELLNEMEFDTFFTGKADTYFDVSDQDGRRAPENRQQDPNPKPKVTVAAFKSEDEYANALYSTTDPDTLEAMGAMFDQQVKRGDFAATT